MIYGEYTHILLYRPNTCIIHDDTYIYIYLHLTYTRIDVYIYICIYIYVYR